MEKSSRNLLTVKGTVKSMFKGTDLIFPLKDIRVRGDLIASIEFYEANANLINRKMQKLRKSLGTIVYSPKDKLLLTIWAAGKHQPNTPMLLRWTFKVAGTGKRISVTSPVATMITNGNSENSQQLLFEIQKLSRLPYYDKFLKFESERIKVNAMAKANAKTLESLYDIKSDAFNVEANIAQVIGEVKIVN